MNILHHTHAGSKNYNARYTRSTRKRMLVGIIVLYFLLMNDCCFRNVLPIPHQVLGTNNEEIRERGERGEGSMGC